MARGERSGQLGVIDLTCDGRDGALEFVLEPVSERLFEGVVFSAALFPARVFERREPLIRDEYDGFERRSARVLAFEIGILRRRKRDVDRRK